MSEETEAGEWVTKADAAAATGIPLRTVQNWAKARKVKTKGRMVLLADVVAQNGGGRRDASAGATDASVALAPRQQLRELARGGASGVGRPPSDGELSARMLRRFEEGGVGPIEVSIEMAVPLERARALHGEWKRAREDSAPGPSVVERLEHLERWAAEHQFVRQDLGAFDGQLRDMKLKVADQALPRRSSFICPRCKSCGWFAVPVVCTHCGEQHEFGFVPPPRKSAR